MPEILTFIQGNRFLMNEIKIKQLLKKNPNHTKKVRIFTF